jgi:hypothetical protein
MLVVFSRTAITLAPLERPLMPLVALPYSGAPHPASQGYTHALSLSLLGLPLRPPTHSTHVKRRPSRTSGDDEDDDEEDEEKEEGTRTGLVKSRPPLTTAERNAAQADAAAVAVDVDEPSSTPAPATTAVTPAAALLFSPMELTRL